MSDDFKAQIQAAQNDLTGTWVNMVNARGGTDHAVELLAKALDLVRDAKNAVDFPWLYQMPAMISGADDHVHALRFGREMRALCGAQPDLQSTVTISQRVPTCPACIAALKPNAEPHE